MRPRYCTPAGSNEAREPTIRGTTAIVESDVSSTCNPRQIRRVVVQHARTFELLCASHPHLRRLVLILRGTDGSRRDEILDDCADASERIHSWIEQRCAIFSNVLIVIVDEGTDEEFLARWITDLTSRPLSPLAAIAVASSDLPHRNLAQPVAGVYL